MDEGAKMAVTPERLVRAEQAIHEATDAAAEKGHATIDRAAGEVHRGASSARAGLEGVADRVEGTLGEARRRVDELAESTLGDIGTSATDLIRKHPGKALLISCAAGLLLASAMRRD